MHLESALIISHTHLSPLSAVLCRSVVSDSLRHPPQPPQGLQSARSSVHGDSPGKNTGVGYPALLQRIFPTQGLNPGLPHCRQILLPTEPPGKPKNTGVDSRSLVQRIFPTQELNRGFLHCRWILHQLSYWRSPKTSQLAENGFDPSTSGLWAQHASAAPLC